MLLRILLLIFSFCLRGCTGDNAMAALMKKLSFCTGNAASCINNYMQDPGNDGEGDTKHDAVQKDIVNDGEGYAKNADVLLKYAVEKAIGQMHKMPPVKHNSSSKIVEELESLGFDSIDETASIERINGMDADYLETYKEDLWESLKFTVYNTGAILPMELFAFLKKAGHTDSDAWAGQKVLFKGTEGSCFYMSMLYRRDPLTRKTDWIVVKLMATFTATASKILLVEDTEDVTFQWFFLHASETRLVEKPKTLSESDLNKIADFFSIVAVKRIGELFGIATQYPSLALDIPKAAGPSFQAAVVQSGTNTFESFGSFLLVGGCLVAAAVLIAFWNQVEENTKKILVAPSSTTPLKSVTPPVTEMVDTDVSYGSTAQL